MNSLSPVLTTILEFSFTRGEAEKMLNIFRLIAEARYYQHADDKTIEKIVATQSHASPEAKYFEALPHLMNEAKKLSAPKLYETIHGIAEELEALPVLTLYVPIRFDHTIVSNIGVWTRKYVEPHVLLQFIISPEYRGGCGVSWHGVMKDYSFNYFLSKHAQPNIKSI